VIPSLKIVFIRLIVKGDKKEHKERGK
jgi:hypothetical protein